MSKKSENVVKRKVGRPRKKKEEDIVQQPEPKIEPPKNVSFKDDEDDDELVKRILNKYEDLDNDDDDPLPKIRKAKVNRIRKRSHHKQHHVEPKPDYTPKLMFGILAAGVLYLFS